MVLIMKEKDSNDRESSEQTHPVQIHSKPHAHIIALSLEDIKEQSDAILRGGHQLPDTVLIWGVLSGPPGTGDRTVQLGNEASAGGWTENTAEEESHS